MDSRLLDAYQEELVYLRERAREFGREHEEVAARLGLKTPEDPDPYVERLLEGVAFLAARVRLQQDDQFPEFTQHLLTAIQPDYLSPMPSICIVGFEPNLEDPALAEGAPIPRHAQLGARASKGPECIFRTAHALQLWPLKIQSAQYLSGRGAAAAAATVPGVMAEAGLRIRIATSGGALASLPIERLPLYLAGVGGVPGALYRQMLGDVAAVVALPDGDAPAVRLPPPEPHGFDDDCSLLPAQGRSFRGYRIMREYFACPERFRFVSLEGLKAAFARADRYCDIVLLFHRQDDTLADAVSADDLRPFCTPAVNLFEKQLGRADVKRFEHEHLVEADRADPLAFEVYRILEITAHGRGLNGRPVSPLYAFGAQLYDWREALFYTTRLRTRRLSTREQRLRGSSDYVGTETYVSLTAPGAPERIDDVAQLSVKALVTNREFPGQLQFSGTGSDFACESSAAVSTTVLRPLTRPRPPLGLGEGAWRTVGHLTPNYASLVSDPDGDPAMLRDLLGLYGATDDASVSRQLDSLRSVTSEPVTRRVPGRDRPAFARGQRVRIVIDDNAFDRSRMFLFATVLDRFLAEFASINSFVETVFESPDQGVFAKWPPRIGQRPTI